MIWQDPVVVLSFVWMVGEMSLIWRRRKTAADAKGLDKRSLPVLFVTLYGAIGLGVWMGMARFGALPRPLFLPLHYVGAVLIACGLAIRWAAIRTLGRFFTVNVTLRPGHRVVKEGLYRYMRHPSYTGGLLGFVGLSMALRKRVNLDRVGAGAVDRHRRGQARAERSLRVRQREEVQAVLPCD